MSDPRRELPSVTALLEMEGVRALLQRAPRAVVLAAVRHTLDAARTQSASEGAPRGDAQWTATVARAVERADRASLRRVVNATGVILHTNLGRAPLAESALQAIASIASGYSNLEFDLDQGQRGSRHVHCAGILRELTGATDAVVVNNCAAALVLSLDTMARGREVIVSRGELIEIGGSFRIPDIMGKSGAQLVEVGTTNRTHLDDYRRAITAQTAAVVKVHRSNFAQEGFVADVPMTELAALVAPRGIAIIHDLGSGLLLSLEEYGFSGEPTAAGALRDGANIVTMSGDKLLGGPQAGIVLGDARHIDAMRRSPLARSYRVDKLTLAALQATLALYHEPSRALREIPTLAMLTGAVDALRDRAIALVSMLPRALHSRVEIVASDASVGGGAFPTMRIPSLALALDGNVTALEERLRLGDLVEDVPPIVGRVAEGRLFLDLRTVLPSEDVVVARALTLATS